MLQISLYNQKELCLWNCAALSKFLFFEGVMPSDYDKVLLKFETKILLGGVWGWWQNLLTAPGSILLQAVLH